MAAKDAMGNELEVGKYVHYKVDTFTWIIAKVEEIRRGGIALTGRKGEMTPGIVKMSATFEVAYDPTNPAVPTIFGIRLPDEKEDGLKLLC